MLKMPPHITDVHRPTNTRAKTPIGTSAGMNEPCEPLNPYMVTVADSGAKIPTSTRMMHTVATVVI